MDQSDHTHNDNPNALVGFLHLGGFYCTSCIDHVHSDNDGHDYARVYLVNVAPYKQHCHDCGRLVVAGRTESWVELWDKKEDPFLTFAAGYLKNIPNGAK